MAGAYGRAGTGPSHLEISNRELTRRDASFEKEKEESPADPTLIRPDLRFSDPIPSAVALGPEKHWFDRSAIDVRSDRPRCPFPEPQPNRIHTTMKFQHLVIAAALPLALVACKDAEVEKAKEEMKAASDDAAAKMKEASAKAENAAKDMKDAAAEVGEKIKEGAADAADKAKDTAADAAQKTSDAAKDAAEKLREE